MPRLTTHVLDTTSGKPAADLRVVLRAGDTVLVDTVTNSEGRAALLEGNAIKRGAYEIAFHAGDYFRKSSAALADPAFLDIIPVRFSLDGKTDAHVPLLISPFGYSAYRGS